MYLKIIAIFLFLIGLNSNVAGQLSIGLEAGISLNQPLNHDYDPAAFHLKPSLGYSIGIPLQYALKRDLFINTQVEVIGKNYMHEKLAPFAGGYISYQNLYFQLPISLEKTIWEKKKFKFSIEAGPFISYWLRNKVAGRLPNLFDTETTLENDQLVETLAWTSFSKTEHFKPLHNRLELGALLGSRLYLNFNKHSLFLRVGLMQSFTHQKQGDVSTNASTINQAYFLRLGNIYHF